MRPPDKPRHSLKTFAKLPILYYTCEPSSSSSSAFQLVSHGLMSAFLVQLLRFPRSNTSSALSFSNRISSSTLASYWVLGLPLGLRPSTVMFIADLATVVTSQSMTVAA
ncbi:hypothetical protein Y032_0814g2486 [Ancylostoma ceylanicum]|uniref:Uncharacterized protein n=1 Tax=Ancylostoma ceylanicum TaxID=53326 RepID=A0A016WDY4_9BILA|nr:hypothetical protein Y032_0814g2486 [Ancylostoma ceylanicum]